MICPKCKKVELHVSIEHIEGCHGDHGENYCYCPSAETWVEIYCSYGKCNFRVKPFELSDFDSIARFLEKNIQESWIEKSSKI